MDSKSCFMRSRSGYCAPSDGRGSNVPYVTPRKTNRSPWSANCLPSIVTRVVTSGVGGVGDRTIVDRDMTSTSARLVVFLRRPAETDQGRAPSRAPVDRGAELYLCRWSARHGV